MKTLLIITSRYSHKQDPSRHFFVKSQVDELSKHFENVVVISTTPYSPKFLSRMMAPQRGRDAMAEDYSYNNIQVFFTKNAVLPLGALRNLKGMQGFRSAIKIIKKRHIQPDIIHAHFTWPCGYIGVKLAKLYSVPVVITIHENRDWFLKEYNSNNEKIYWTWRNPILIWECSGAGQKSMVLK